MTILPFERTAIEIQVRNPALQKTLEQSIGIALTAFVSPPVHPVIRLRTFRRFETVDVARRIVIIRVTAAGLRRLPRLVEAIRARSALGVQLVWDGEEPPRARAEPVLFRILETARATKSGPPVVLAAERTPVLNLRALIAARSQA